MLYNVNELYQRMILYFARAKFFYSSLNIDVEKF